MILGEHTTVFHVRKVQKSLDNMRSALCSAEIRFSGNTTIVFLDVRNVLTGRTRTPFVSCWTLGTSLQTPSIRLGRKTPRNSSVHIAGLRLSSSSHSNCSLCQNELYIPANLPDTKHRFAFYPAEMGDSRPTPVKRPEPQPIVGIIRKPHRYFVVSRPLHDN